eukprot:TRINITY_DN56064_c0_g1_i1.p2 TRINITY_DN56064_c0_g1~~TRINITY_DN56064_c0_g1_i1.p2  ORF type:complete len:254 (+),score=55.44 TRINITY_DN56064_c0_g1_i1:84-845(+)
MAPTKHQSGHAVDAHSGKPGPKDVYQAPTRPPAPDHDSDRMDLDDCGDIEQPHSANAQRRATQRGPRRVLLLRHGQSEANATGRDVRDAQLTQTGVVQGSSWRSVAASLKADVVLASPLRRAVHTALLAFQDTDVPIEIVHSARELWWGDQQNQPLPLPALKQFLRECPRGADVVVPPPPETPFQSELHSVRAFHKHLLSRPEQTIAVACHFGVIQELCGHAAHNAEIVECEVRGERLKPVRVHKPPRGGSTW